MDVLSACALCVCALLSVAHARLTHLFGAHPNGGVWGGALETTGAGSMDALPDMAYPGLKQRVAYASYDGHSKQMLMEIADPPSLVYGPLCTSNKDLPRVLANLTSGSVAVYHEEWGDCYGCEVGAFTLHNSKIYFVMTGDYMTDGVMTRSIQVRVLQNCERCGGGDAEGGATIASVIKCSKVISTVYERSFPLHEIDDIALKVSKTMRIVKRNRVLSFYFTVANLTESEESGTEVRLQLYKATNKNDVYVLHTETVDSKFSGWDIAALGSVDVKEAMVCWTAADR